QIEKNFYLIYIFLIRKNHPQESKCFFFDVAVIDRWWGHQLILIMKISTIMLLIKVKSLWFLPLLMQVIEIKQRIVQNSYLLKRMQDAICLKFPETHGLLIV